MDKKLKWTKNPETDNLTNPYWEEQNSKAQEEKKKNLKIKNQKLRKERIKIKSLKVEHKNKVPIGPYLSKFLHSKKEELYVTNTKTSYTTKFYEFYFDYWRKLRLIDIHPPYIFFWLEIIYSFSNVSYNLRQLLYIERWCFQKWS